MDVLQLLKRQETFTTRTKAQQGSKWSKGFDKRHVVTTGRLEVLKLFVMLAMLRHDKAIQLRSSYEPRLMLLCKLIIYMRSMLCKAVIISLSYTRSTRQASNFHMAFTRREETQMYKKCTRIDKNKYELFRWNRILLRLVAVATSKLSKIWHKK